MATLCLVGAVIFTLPKHANAAAFDCLMDGDLKSLVKTEFGMTVEDDVLLNVPKEKLDAALLALQRLQLGRNLYASRTCTERAASSLAKWVETELEIGKLERVLDNVLSIFDKLAKTSVSKTVTIGRYSRIGVTSMLAGAYLLGDAPTKERIVYEYINFRKDVGDEEAWGEVVARYEGYKELAGIPGFAQKALKIIDDQKESEDLRAYAQFIYESYQLAQEVDGNQKAKQEFKNQITEMFAGTKPQAKTTDGGFFSWLWNTVAKPFKYVINTAKTLFTKSDTNTQLPAQMSGATGRDDEKCKITINLSGISFEMKEGSEPKQRPAGLTKDHVSAGVIKKNDIGQYHLELTFTNEGKRRFSEITDRISRSGGSLSLYINNNLVSSPVVMARIVSDTLLVGGEPYAKIEQIVGKRNINNPCPEKETAQPPRNNLSVASPLETLKLAPKVSCDRNLGSFPFPAVSLEWNVNKNKTAESQILYRDGNALAKLPASGGHGYFDGTVKAGETYTYLVRTDYKDGSSESAKAVVVIPADACTP